MHPDTAAQSTDQDKYFILRYNLLHDANDKARQAVREQVNSRLNEPHVQTFVKGVHKINKEVSEKLKEYEKIIVGIDETRTNIVRLDDHSTYPIYFGLLSRDNQGKIKNFEKSVQDFGVSYRMFDELSDNIEKMGQGVKSKRKRKKSRTRRRIKKRKNAR